MGPRDLLRFRGPFQRSEWHAEVVDAVGPTAIGKVTFTPSQEEPLGSHTPPTSLWALELHSPSAPACLHTVGGQETPAEQLKTPHISVTKASQPFALKSTVSGVSSLLPRFQMQGTQEAFPKVLGPHHHSGHLK